VYNPKKLKIDDSVQLADVYGVFRAHRPPGLIILGSCSDAIIEIDKFVAVPEEGGASRSTP
jgi:hypothetical protein